MPACLYMKKYGTIGSTGYHVWLFFLCVYMHKRHEILLLGSQCQLQGTWEVTRSDNYIQFCTCFSVCECYRVRNWSYFKQPTEDWMPFCFVFFLFLVMNNPDLDNPGWSALIRSRKLSRVSPGWYLIGRPLRKSRVAMQRQAMANHQGKSLALKPL
ncbi:UNVERIFIED_CONTAM: hypothetical protein K2H54_074901 [Gekko kuhli]